MSAANLIHTTSERILSKGSKMYSDQNKSWASHVGCSLQVDIMTNPVVEWQTEEDAF